MKKIRISSVLIYTLLFVLTLTMIIPILHLLALSLTDPLKAHHIKGLAIIPSGFSLINYKVLFANPLITRSIFNSIFITVVGTLLNLVLTALAAYVLTRPRFVGKSFFMVFLILIMVFEPGMVPEYLLVKNLGLLNSFGSVILYKAVDVYYLIILMRFFEDIPDSIIEAARIDGAGHISIFARIILPLSKPALATMGLFYAVFHWNEFFRASIYLNDPKKWPLQLVLRQFVVERDNTTLLGVDKVLSYKQIANLDYTSLQAGTIILAIVPLIILYPLILKFYAKGALDGGVKD
jgi:putative aldouronate transport system permease protein